MEECGNDPKISRLPVRGLTQDRESIVNVRQEVEQLLAEAEPQIAPEPISLPQGPEPPPPLVVLVPEVPKGPPPHHPNAMVCPQCDEWTWRATQECVRCRYALFLHAQREQSARNLAWKAERDQKLKVWAILLGGGGVLAIFASAEVSGSLGVLGALAGMAAIFGAFVCVKVVEHGNGKNKAL